MIRRLKLGIAKLRRDHYGHSAERRARLIDQMERRLGERGAVATDNGDRRREGENSGGWGFERRCPVVGAPPARSLRATVRILKMGEDILRQWKIIQIVRETFAWRTFEAISRVRKIVSTNGTLQPHAPRLGRAEPDGPFNCLPLFEAFGRHQRLNRQAERHAKGGFGLNLATLADQVGALRYVSWYRSTL